MKNLFTAIVLFLLTVASWAQSTPKYTKIIDGGSIRSTPHLCDNPLDLNGLIAVTDPDFAKQLCPYAEEDKWPSAIETLDKRNNGGRELLIKCNIYYVADIGDDAVLLWVPMEINQNMPAEMRDKGDFLVMIGKEAVELGDKVSLYGDKKKEIAVAEKSGPKIDLNAIGFEDQLANIVADFQNAFKTIKGSQIPQKQGSLSLSTDYNSKIALSGAENSYLSESSFGSSIPAFIATLGDFDDKTTAIAKYKEIVGTIQDMDFPCCTFIEMDEVVNESLISQGFIPFDLDGSMAEEFENIVLEVEVMKNFRLSNDHKMIDQWSVVLRVKEL